MMFDIVVQDLQLRLNLSLPAVKRLSSRSNVSTLGVLKGFKDNALSLRVLAPRDKR